MDRSYALKGSLGSLDVFKSRLVTLRLRCGLATRLLDKELDIVHVYTGELDSARRMLVNLSLSNSIWTLNHVPESGRSHVSVYCVSSYINI